MGERPAARGAGARRPGAAGSLGARGASDATSPGLLLLTGDAFLIGERLREIEQQTLGDARILGAHEVLHAERADLDAIATAVRTVAPGGRRLVVLRQVDKLKDEAQRALLALLDEVPQSSRLVLVAESPDMRRALFVALRERGAVVQLGIGSARDPAGTRRELLALVEGRAKQSGLRLRPEAAQAIVEFVDNDPGRLVRELEKLALRYGTSEDVGLAQALDSLGGERALGAFALEGALRERRIGRAIVELRALLAHGERPEVIVGQLAGELRSLLRARALLDSGLDEEQAKRAFGSGRGYFVVPRARSYRREELEAALRELARIDLAAKTGACSVAARLERWLIGLARPAQGH